MLLGYELAGFLDQPKYLNGFSFGHVRNPVP
jgi:hypothetical protein